MKKIESFLKNILLQILLFASKAVPGNNPEQPGNFSKILFIRLNRIGDALVTTPLLHLIKKKINPKIYLLADKKNYFVYQNNPDIDEIVIFKKGVKGILDILSLIKKEKIDTLVDLHDDISTTVSFIIALSRAKNKFGLEKGNKSIYTKTIPKLDSKKIHIVSRLVEIAKLFKIRTDNSRNWIGYYPSYASLKKAEEFVQKAFQKKNFLIGVNISAGSDARFWGVDRFKSLINFLLNYNLIDINVLLLSASKDLNYTDKIINVSKNSLAKGEAALFCSEDFDEFAAIISNLNMLFTPDTAAVHLAAAFRIPVFGIYVHDTDDMIWSPYGVDFECVATKEPNLKNMDFEEVRIKFGNFLKKQLSEKSASD